MVGEGTKRPNQIKSINVGGKGFGVDFLDSKGVLLTDFLLKGSTMNSKHYVEVLDKLRYSIKNKRRGALQKGYFLFHDKFSSQTAKIVYSVLDGFWLWKSDHPPYSTDLDPCDIYLFPNLKKITRRKKYEDDNEVIVLAQKILNEFWEEFSCEAMKELRHKLERCIELDEDYVEKPQNVSE